MLIVAAVVMCNCQMELFIVAVWQVKVFTAFFLGCLVGLPLFLGFRARFLQLPPHIRAYLFFPTLGFVFFFN